MGVLNHGTFPLGTVYEPRAEPKLRSILEPKTRLMGEVLSREDASRSLPAAIFLEQACLPNEAGNENQTGDPAGCGGTSDRFRLSGAPLLPQEVSGQDPEYLPWL